MKTVVCHSCNRDVAEKDFFEPCNMCDDCFDKMMDREEKDFSILDAQHGLCSECKKYIFASVQIQDNGVKLNKDEDCHWTVFKEKAMHIKCFYESNPGIR